MTRHSAPEVIVVGGGLVGLACAWCVAARGASVLVFSERLPGEASPAAAGMLAPSVEHAEGPAHRFALAARDHYPDFLAALADATGRRVPLLRNGIIELVPEAGDVEARRRAAPPGSSWLEPAEIRALEPELARVAGALFHPDDGAVDNVTLRDALEESLDQHPRARVLRERVLEVMPADGSADVAGVRTERGERHEARVVVLAAGAWVSALGGLPRSLPVEPVRGQMLSYAAAPLGHVTYGAHGYVVPRGGATVAGSTMEHVGFEVGTTSDGQAAIGAAVGEICPPLARAPVRDRWSGLRPVTPDLQPIIGREPARASLVYACGHSRNGVLLGPLTGECVAALVAGEEPPHDLTPFRAERF